MLMFTSIKPPKSEDEIAYQHDCIASWRAAGFDPVAVNGPGEIEALQRLDLSIAYWTAPTDGKPRIGAILEAIRQFGAPFAGIINGDCKLIAHPYVNPADRTCIVCWRMDEASGKPTRYGFDAFLFDTSILPSEDHNFNIGSPWWDIWFPYACQQNGAHIIVPKAASLSHRSHPLNWSRAKWVDNGRRFWKIMGREGEATVADLYKIGIALPHEWRGSKPSVSETLGNRLRGFIFGTFHSGIKSLNPVNIEHAAGDVVCRKEEFDRVERTRV